MRPLNGKEGAVLWFTGLSGSGKTTTAREAASVLREQGRRVEWLDGDELRKTLSSDLGFTPADRLEHIRRVVELAKTHADSGAIVLVSAITPYRSMRAYARSVLPRFVEIYVECPLEVCERRDVKGLYAKARLGLIPNFTGLSDVYEPPEHAELTIHTDEHSLTHNVEKIMLALHALDGH